MCAQRAVVATRGATGRIMRAGATHWEATAAFILVNVSHNVECERMFCFFRVSQGLPRRWEEWEEWEESEEEEEEGGRGRSLFCSVVYTLLVKTPRGHDGGWSVV
jgi:hypothetical protein